MKEGCINIELEDLKVTEWGNAYRYAKNFLKSEIIENCELQEMEILESERI